MFRTGTLLILFSLFTLTLPAQADCTFGRYVSEIFPNFTRTNNITYGSNINLQGQTQSLELDVYEPTGDNAALRPLIVLEHGGSFMFGDKGAVDMTELAEPLARMGYVVASVEYRLGMQGMPFPGPDSATASEAVWRAVSDFKAAVRWFYKDAATNGNTYKIDTNRIFIGGVSAGAVAALHYAYLDDINEMPSYIDTSKAGLGGGIEGSSGNAGYSSKIQGVVSLCGMIADTSWMRPGDEPIVSLHGTADDVVPYATALITVVGVYPIFEVDGSYTVHQRASQVGVDNCLYTWPGAAHTPEVGSPAYTDTALTVITAFLKGLVCNTTTSDCGYLVGVDQPVLYGDLEVFPNPAHAGTVKVRVPETWTEQWTYEVMDATGRTVMRGTQKLQEAELGLGEIAPGVYTIRAQSEAGALTGRVIVQ